MVNDSRTVPACRECHDRCGGSTVNGKPPISESQQALGVAFTLDRWTREASSAAWAAFTEDRERWIASRGGIPE